LPISGPGRHRPASDGSPGRRRRAAGWRAPRGRGHPARPRDVPAARPSVRGPWRNRGSWAFGTDVAGRGVGDRVVYRYRIVVTACRPEVPEVTATVGRTGHQRFRTRPVAAAGAAA